MTIPFKNIPGNLRTPLFYAEIDPSKANTSAQVQRTLLIGQISAAGTLAANVPVPAQSVSGVKAAAGVGSVLAQMMSVYRDNDPNGEVWILPLADDPAATAATGTITFTGPTTASGSLALYIAGQLVSVALATGSTAAQAATAVTAAINAAIDLPVTAVAAAAVVTTTAKNKGLVGNDIDIRVNYLGAPGGEATPAGLGVTIVAMTGGATSPVLTTALANLQDTSFDFIVCSLTDATSTAAIKALLNDVAGRWAWSSQLYGHAFYGLRGTTGTLAAWGTALNDQHASVIGFPDSPSLAYAWAAAVAGAAASSLRQDPGLPLQTLALVSVLPPPVASRFGLLLRNGLLYGGVSTFTVASNGAVAIENVITTYVTNAQGQPDNSYLQIETMFLLVYVLRALRNVVATKYGRVKLAADGTRLFPGNNVVTPSVIKADIIAAYRELEADGMVQQSDVFAANLVVEKDATNPNRVNILFPSVLIDQLRVFAALIQFRLI